MGTGFLTIQTRTAEDEFPVKAHVTITHPDGTVFYETEADMNGNTGYFPLNAPDAELTLDPSYMRPAYSVCDVNVYAEGYRTVHIHDVEIVDTCNTILPVRMIPHDTAHTEPEIDVDIPPIGLLDPAPREQMDPTTFVQSEVVIPDYITVHLGTPTNAAARNVKVKFYDYIKNVVSSELC